MNPGSILFLSVLALCVIGFAFPFIKMMITMHRRGKNFDATVDYFRQAEWLSGSAKLEALETLSFVRRFGLHLLHDDNVLAAQGVAGSLGHFIDAPSPEEAEKWRFTAINWLESFKVGFDHYLFYEDFRKDILRRLNTPRVY